MNAIPKQIYWRSEAYRRWIASLPCCICRRPDVQAAHVKFIAPGRGMGIKVSDEYIVPLCVDHHRAQELSQTGERAWWEAQGKDPAHIAETLYLAWMKWKDSGDTLQTYVGDFLR